MVDLIAKERQLVERIEKAKADLAKLKKKRSIECGQLVVKYGLDQYPTELLDKEFESLAVKLKASKD